MKILKKTQLFIGFLQNLKKNEKHRKNKKRAQECPKDPEYAKKRPFLYFWVPQRPHNH